MTGLRRDLTAAVTAPEWATVAEHLGHLLDAYFRATNDTAAADLAAVRVDCAGLAHMGGIAPRPNAARVRDALTVRLRAHQGVYGSAGVGVSVGPIAAGVGRDLDVSIVVGAAEGTVPAPRRDDPLLPAWLVGVTVRDHLEHQRRAFAGAVGAVCVESVVIFPRGSLHGGAEKVPSRWLIPVLGRLAGTDVDVVGWQRQTENAPAIVAVESFDVAAQRGDDRIGASAASETEWRRRELAAVPANQWRGALDDPIINLGMQMRGGRLNGRFTRFNGNVSNVRDRITTFRRPVSPTELETWVKSPYQYYLEHVLGLKALDDPDETAQVDPLTRGDLIHRILEGYVQETINGAEPDDDDRLRRIAAVVLDGAEADSPGWLAQLWAKDRGIITRDLADWFGRDAADHRAGWSPTHAEQTFGDAPAVALDLGGATIAFRGQVDRIDTYTDGTIRVTDYKTGQAKPYANLSDRTPTSDGKQFQLPVYGLSARTLGDNVTARYWFITAKGKFAEIGYPVTDDVIAGLTEDMTLVHASITAGHFPPKIEDTHGSCPWWTSSGAPASNGPGPTWKTSTNSTTTCRRTEAE